MSSGQSRLQAFESKSVLASYISSKTEDRSSSISQPISKKMNIENSDPMNVSLTGASPAAERPSHTAKSQQAARPGATPTSESTPKERINLDEVIHIMSARAEVQSPLQHLDKNMMDTSSDIRSPLVKKASPFHARSELPIVPLADFTHPDFPSADWPSPKPAKRMSWYMVIHSCCFVTLTLAVVVAMAFTDISTPDPSTRAFMDPLPARNKS